MTLSLDLLLSLCTALAIGLLIGAERGWQERDHEDARQIAGIRTFSLSACSAASPPCSLANWAAQSG